MMLRLNAAVCVLACSYGLAQSTPSAPPANPAKPSPPASALPAPTLKEQAWTILHQGTGSQKTEERVDSIRAISLLRGDREASRLARNALGDSKPQVRLAAAVSLGELRSRASIPKLRTALADNDVQVVLAAAHSLLLMKENSAYDVYFAILTGERKGHEGMIAGQMETLKDPKKMAMMGFEEGIGFVPFGGIGYTAIKTIVKDDSSPVRAAAARVLADDPDPATAQGLIERALGDKSELVRAASLDALGRHGDPALVDKLSPALTDAKPSVRYVAAGAVLRLTDLGERQAKKK